MLLALVLIVAGRGTAATWPGLDPDHAAADLALHLGQQGSGGSSSTPSTSTTGRSAASRSAARSSTAPTSARAAIRGTGAQWCNANFALPKGTIVATGVQRSPFFYQLSVVGGSGIYANVIGTVVVSQLARRHYNLIFALQAL